MVSCSPSNRLPPSSNPAVVRSLWACPPPPSPRGSIANSFSPGWLLELGFLSYPTPPAMRIGAPLAPQQRVFFFAVAVEGRFWINSSVLAGLPFFRPVYFGTFVAGSCSRVFFSRRKKCRTVLSRRSFIFCLPESRPPPPRSTLHLVSAV